MTICSRPSRHRRGYLLIEIITVVALLAVFTVIIGSTFTAAYRGQVDAIRRDDRAHHVDAAIAHLRRDIWNAKNLTATPDGLTLTDSSNLSTTWNWSGKSADSSGGVNTWTRTLTGDHPSTMHFPDCPTENIAAEIHGPTVLLHFGGQKFPPESIAFISQVAIGAAK